LFDRARGRLVGSDEYLTKPFSKETLLQAVSRHSGRGGPTQSGGNGHADT
jgi:twitching motility two-component system response regulator PilG